MDKNETINILEDWNFWKKDLDSGVARPTYLNRPHGFLKTKQIVVITGARQKIYETYLEFLNPKGKPYIFLDESSGGKRMGNLKTS